MVESTILYFLYLSLCVVLRSVFLHQIGNSVEKCAPECVSLHKTGHSVENLVQEGVFLHEINDSVER